MKNWACTKHQGYGTTSVDNTNSCVKCWREQKIKDELEELEEAERGIWERRQELNIKLSELIL